MPGMTLQLPALLQDSCPDPPRSLGLYVAACQWAHDEVWESFTNAPKPDILKSPQPQ